MHHPAIQLPNHLHVSLHHSRSYEDGGQVVLDFYTSDTLRVLHQMGNLIF